MEDGAHVVVEGAVVVAYGVNPRSRLGATADELTRTVAVALGAATGRQP